MVNLPLDKMPEAEVSLRLTIGLIESGLAIDTIEVAIDGAQIQTSGRVHFPLIDFLTECGWYPVEKTQRWQTLYMHEQHSIGFLIHSKSGKGDVVAPLSDGRRLRVESKKGPLVRSRSSAEYPLIREALGQLLTVEEAFESDLLAVAVPSSEKFETLAANWRLRPLIVKSGIQIITVDRSNHIRGLIVS